MDKKRTVTNFIVDIRIHYQDRVLRLSFGHILRWLLPAIMIAYRVASHLRESAS